MSFYPGGNIDILYFILVKYKCKFENKKWNQNFLKKKIEIKFFFWIEKKSNWKFLVQENSLSIKIIIIFFLVFI